MTGDHRTAFGAIIVAAGASTRFQSGSKILAPLNGVPVLRYALELFTQLDASHIVVVLGSDTLKGGSDLVNGFGHRNLTTCSGGATRTDSVRAGLADFPSEVDLIAIHDAARPLATEALAMRIIARAARSGAAVPIVPVVDTIVSITDDGQVEAPLDRSQLRSVQTPQAFRRDWLERCLDGAAAYSDEGSALRAFGYPVSVVEGDPSNMKITWPGDLAIAEAILRQREGG